MAPIAPASHAAIVVAGETVLLLAGKALYWPAQQVLMVADIHFGKAAAFRALGVPVPGGTSVQNLDALDALLVLHPVRHIVFLGDFLHARAAHAVATLAALQAWRADHPALRLTLVRGNHDQHAGDPPAALHIDLVDEPFRLGPFALCHHPEPLDETAAGYVLAGHVHPVFRLRAGRDALSLPCFVVGDRRMILPSFGAFTGGYTITREPGERIFLVAGEALLELHAAAGPGG
jgi:DNA ligase-associated metallophosphoesterase